MIDFKLPSLGADMDDGTLIAWKVTPGQQVHKGDVVAIVDTTKAAVDLESWVEGRVHELITQPGQKIAVGTVMARFLAPDEPAPVAPVAAVATVAPAPSAAGTPPRQRASPAARQRAVALGIDLATLAGSGPEGAVTLRDVEAAATAAPSAAAPAAPFAPSASPAERAAGMRHAIAAAMARSKREIPHYYLAETVPMQAALQWLAARNAARPVTGRLLPAVLLLKAVALALRKVPELNGRFVDGAFRPAGGVHVGVAISLRTGGLVAPALHDVDTTPLDTLMVGLADLVTRCRAGQLLSSELTDAGITLTNLGDTGVEAVFGVIYPPQVALVGFGRIADRPWVVDGAVLVQPTVQVSLAADHRVSDGHRGALFLGEVHALLQQPALLDATEGPPPSAGKDSP